LKVRALLIDLDGTLVDTTDTLVEAARQASKAVGLHNLDPRIGLELARLLQSNHPIDDLLHKKGILGTTKRKFVKAYIKAFHRLASEKTKPLPNVHATLGRLSESLSLALITRRSVSRNQLTRELNRLGFLSYFRTVVTSLDVSESQPSPEVLFKAAEKLGVPIEECAVVSDSIVDIQAGKAASIKTIAVLSGLFSREELEKWNPDFIIPDIKFLPDLLEKRA
jgi:HAD superfamily hydrolase (TIGR01509 family)